MGADVGMSWLSVGPNSALAGADLIDIIDFS